MRNPSKHDAPILSRLRSHSNKIWRVLIRSNAGIYSRASRFSGYNKLGDKKNCTRNNIITRRTYTFSRLSFSPCRLIIERQHKILVTHFTRKASCVPFLFCGKCDVLTFIVKFPAIKKHLQWKFMFYLTPEHFPLALLFGFSSLNVVCGAL